MVASHRDGGDVSESSLSSEDELGHKKIAVSVSELKRFPIVTRKWTLLQGWHEESKLLRTCSILNFLP